ncbi:MAG: protein-disulfide reductase DsbD [Proteobacteria bacterium]|nr:protein-disulfide reductase DsbD [Pseudomonadota bacterium]
MRHIAGIALLALLSLRAVAADPPAPAPGAAPSGLAAALARSGEDDFLQPDQAFRLDVVPEGSDRVGLNFEIADGYYLYRARIKVASASTAAQLGALQMPDGQVKNDEYFGRQEVYHHELRATLPVARANAKALELPLEVTYQGCADKGLCYPPITKSFTVKLAGGAAGAAPTPGSATGGAAGGSEQDHFAALLRNASLLAVLGSFYLAGLLLSFTPCVLPMVPILSGIIFGGGRSVSTARGFSLSLSYVLGMALTYTLAGLAAAAAGKQVQALFQQWWVLALFAALFVALALSMFGLFTVQMPAAIQTRLANVSNRQSGGSLGGVAVMGALSALIVTTCVGPALVGALIVISETGQMARGGAALFAMSIGMGTPLLAVGASAGRFLPKAGPWMELVKKLFGVMMLAVAAWMLARITPDRLTLVLWSVPALALAWLLWRQRATRTRPAGVMLRTAGTLAGAYGLALLAGAALGHGDPLAPLALSAQAHAQALPFRPIRSLAELDREVAQARARGKTVLVDFSAEWCTSCKEMERYTFTDKGVQTALAQTVLLRADVTANNADDQALLRHFGIFGPPTIAFYGSDGQERAPYRVVGFMKADAFAARVHAALNPST